MPCGLPLQTLRVGAQRPAMAEDDGLAHAPVIVIELRAVLGGYRCHASVPFPVEGKDCRRVAAGGLVHVPNFSHAP